MFKTAYIKQSGEKHEESSIRKLFADQMKPGRHRKPFDASNAYSATLHLDAI